MRAVVCVVFAAIVGLACDTSPKTFATKAPLEDLKIYGGDEAIADLTEGVSARSIVGTTLFADFEPGWTP